MRSRRFYFACARCRSRTVLVARPRKDKWERYYLCKVCSARWTYYVYSNSIEDEWPREVLERAVHEGVIASDGRVLIG